MLMYFILYPVLIVRVLILLGGINEAMFFLSGVWSWIKKDEVRQLEKTEDSGGTA